jgi:hypothetical protein
MMGGTCREIERDAFRICGNLERKMPFVIPRNRRKVLLNEFFISRMEHLCGLVVRVPGYRFRDLGSIPGTTTFSEK